MKAIFEMTKLKQRAQGTKNVSQTVSTRTWTFAENVLSPGREMTLSMATTAKKHKKIARKILMTLKLPRLSYIPSMISVLQKVNSISTNP